MENLIKADDFVSVNFHNSQKTLCHRALVHYVPVATGDSWIFLEHTGDVHYVSEGCTVTKLEEQE